MRKVSPPWTLQEATIPGTMLLMGIWVPVVRIRNAAATRTRPPGPRAVLVVLLLLLPFPSCSREPISASRPRSPSWAAQDVRGLPSTAQIIDVVVGERGWVAVGAVQGRYVAGEPYDMAVWRSSDGLTWREAYRTRARGDESTKGRLTVTADGFAVVGTACRGQACHPIALVSSDGKTWRPATRPPGGLDVGGSLRGAVSGVTTIRDAAGRPGRALVAVGYASSESGAGSRDARPVVWRSGDAGRTWDTDSPALAGASSVSPLDQVESVGQIVVAHGSEEGADHVGHDVLWRSDDAGRHWGRVAVPERADASTMPVTGHPRGALVLIGRRPSGEPSLWRSEDLTHWTEATTVPARYGSLLDTGGGLVFARSRAYGGSRDRLELWGSGAGAERFDRTFVFGPKEQPELQGMLEVDHQVFVYLGVGRPGTRGFLRLAAGRSCAVAACPGTPTVPPDTVALTRYRAELVPVAFGSQRVLVAGEGGDGWSDVTPERLLGSADESVEDAVFPDRQHGWLAVANVEELGSWVLRTIDGGRTWATTGYEGGFSMHAGTSLQVAAVDADHAWTAFVVPPAGGSPILGRTADGGQTWSGVDEPRSEDDRIANAIRFTDRLHGFSADDLGFFGNRGLFATGDSGVTWAERRIPLPAGADRDQASYGLPRFVGRRGVLPVAIVEPNNAEATRARVAFYLSDDGGATWRPASNIDVAPGSKVQAAVASPEVWWAADGAASVISVTADAGRTWAEHRPVPGTPGGLRIVHVADAATAVATARDGSTGSLLVTHDGGSTWSPLFAPAPEPAGRGVACPNPGPAQVPGRATDLTVARGDLDGDGQADRLVFYTVPADGREQAQWRMRAELAGGRAVDVTEHEWRSRGRPVGGLDLDRNDRQEIFVAVEGADSAALGAVVLNGCELTTVFGLGSPAVYYDTKDRPERGTAGVSCTDVDGDGDPEIVAARTGPQPGTWSYTAYRITGASALTARSGHGTSPGQPRPYGISFSPGLHCDGLTP